MSFKTADLSSASDIYFKPKDGVNKIRIVSSEVTIYKAFLVEKNEEGDKALTFLTVEGMNKFVPRADKEIPKKLFGMWIIDRATGKMLIYECGVMVMKQLQSLANDADYGFDTIPEYDLKLTKEGELMATKYSVMPSPILPLTDYEKDCVSKLEPLINVYLKEAQDANEYNPL